ncbi:MAG: fructose bisphosphate aldolase [Gammaproteobacteria bacterium]|nr:fructose bisphosphate aldolase [Gammaproteobacteria bacterium]
MTDYNQQLQKIKSQNGFIAALDQSGGSTPTALKSYGVDSSAWTNDEGMYSVVHQMRARIMTSPSFTGERVIGAILFENTMDREVEGKSTAEYLWSVKQVVPFLKVDKGLSDEANGVQLLKPMPQLDELLAKAKSKGIFGTKMRSVIKLANQAGIEAVVKQQFEVAKQIIAAGLMPIIEPEVDINSSEKAQAEVMLQTAILAELDQLTSDQQVMLKVTLPEVVNSYAACIAHPNTAKVVALSGGYDRDHANERLTANKGIIASFSRALSQGLSAQQSSEEFDATMNTSIEAIYQASST